jgi:hypothetical protein
MTAVKSTDLCWGQRYFWLHRHWIPADARHDEHVVLRHDLPDGIALARVRLILNQLVRRHEALRTTIRIDPDGRPRQRVHPPAPVPVTVTGADPDVLATPAEVIRRHAEADFDLATEPPLRAVVVTVGGAPRQLVLIFQHIAVDDWSVAALNRELDALLAAIGRPASLAPVRHQPADLAGREAAEYAARREADLGHWRAEVAGLPSDGYARRRRGGVAGSCSASLTSPNLLAAARETAARLQVWPSAVYLAAYAVLMAAYSGGDRAPFWLFTSRRDPAAEDAVLTSMFAPMLVNPELAGRPPLSAAIRQVAERLDRGKRHLATPYDEMVELIALEGARRGRAIRLAAEVNLLNYAPRPCGARRSRFAWNREPAAWARSGADSYFRIYEWQDGVTIALRASAAVLDPAATERFLRAYEELLLAHRDPATDRPVDEIARRAGFGAPPGGAADRPTGGPAGPDRASLAVCAGEADLVAAVAAVNCLADVDPLESYVAAGGRALRAPAVLAALTDRGWAGLRVPELLDIRPLRALAGRLTPAGGRPSRG